MKGFFDDADPVWSLNGGKVLLFLDFDGVLHPFPIPSNATQLFANLSRLESVLRDFPEVQVVISSSWREGRSLSELRALFSNDIAMRVIGVTPQLPITGLSSLTAIRHKEIEQFLKEHEVVGEWLALDDDPSLFPPNCPRLLLCEMGLGGRRICFTARLA